MIKNFFITALTIAYIVSCYKLNKIEREYLEYQEAHQVAEQEQMITIEKVPPIEFEGEEITLSGNPSLTC